MIPQRTAQSVMMLTLPFGRHFWRVYREKDIFGWSLHTLETFFLKFKNSDFSMFQHDCKLTFRWTHVENPLKITKIGTIFFQLDKMVAKAIKTQCLVFNRILG